MSADMPTSATETQAGPAEGLPAAPALAEDFDDLESVEEVEPERPELLDEDEPGEDEPERPELLDEAHVGQPARPAAPRPAAPAGAPGARNAPAAVKDLPRARRRVRGQLRTVTGMEALREALERGLLAGVPPAELEEEVARVEREREKAAGRSAGAKTAAREWGRMARAACAQAVAAAEPPEVVEVEPAAPAGPTPAGATGPVSSAARVLYMGHDADRVERKAESILWLLESAAEVTAGTCFDLAKARGRVLFKGTQAERPVRSDPVSRITELWAVKKVADEDEAGEDVEPEDPTWELVAYGFAVACALVQRNDVGALLTKAKGLWRQGAVGAARGVKSALGKVQRRGK